MARRTRPLPTESVWDYPRPPRLERSEHRVRVVFGGRTIVDTTEALRVLETSHPPTYYVPPSHARFEFLVPSLHRSRCEWKGQAQYWTLRVGERESIDAAWSCPEPTAEFLAMRDYLAFYLGRVDACYVGDEGVSAQEGEFYGGWIPGNIRGPFKGGPGTFGW